MADTNTEFWIEEAKREAARPNGQSLAVNGFASIAVAMALDRIAGVLEWAKEDYLADQAEERQLPCNEMGGGSAGLDTADDFAMHCSKADKHDGPHSYEEDEHANQR